VYNEEKLIQRCLDSILRQTYDRIEIIIIDDGSTDRTLNLLYKYKGLKVIKQKHQGPGTARNLGANNAQGEILVFVDADMELHPNYIQELIRPILDEGAIGTDHAVEEVANLDNVWAYCWGKERLPKMRSDSIFFRAIKRQTFLELGGFDPSKGYFDDRTLYDKLQQKAKVSSKAICYHFNPSSLKEIFDQSMWQGESYLKYRQNLFIFSTLYVIKKILFILAPLTVFLSIIYPILAALIIPSVYEFIKAIKLRDKRFHFFIANCIIFSYVYDFGFIIGLLKYLLTKA
jgi:glycosyltransferase involved in cell wall biosynthesis